MPNIAKADECDHGAWVGRPTKIKRLCRARAGAAQVSGSVGACFQGSRLFGSILLHPMQSVGLENRPYLRQTRNAKRVTPPYKPSLTAPSCVTRGDFDREIMSSCDFSKAPITGAKLGFWPRMRLQIVET